MPGASGDWGRDLDGWWYRIRCRHNKKAAIWDCLIAEYDICGGSSEEPCSMYWSGLDGSDDENNVFRGGLQEMDEGMGGGPYGNPQTPPSKYPRAREY